MKNPGLEETLVKDVGAKKSARFNCPLLLFLFFLFPFLLEFLLSLVSARDVVG